MALTASNIRDDAAAGAARLLLRLGVASLALGLPCLALLSRRAGFIVFPISVALILLAAMLRAGDRAPLRFASALRSRLGIAALFLVGWAALSLVWTPFREGASGDIVRIALTGVFAAACAAALPQHTRSADLYLLPIGVGAGAALALLHVFWSVPIAATEPEVQAWPRGVVTLSVLVWPALGALWARRHVALATALFAAVVVAALLNWAPISLIALSCGALVFALGRGDLRMVTRGLGLLTCVLFLVAPIMTLLTDAVFSARGLSEADIARGVAQWATIIKADPARLLTGHGFDAAVRSVQAGFLTPGAPRSFLFEIWYDLGVIGAGAFAALVYFSFAAAGRAGEAAGPALAAGLAACLVFAISGLHTTQIWWVTLLACGLIATTLVVRGQYRTERPLAQFVEAEGRE